MVHFCAGVDGQNRSLVTVNNGRIPRLAALPLWNLIVQLHKNGPEHKVKQECVVPYKHHKLRPKGVHQVQLGPPAVTNQRIRTQTDLRGNVQPSINVSEQWTAEVPAGLGEAGRPLTVTVETTQLLPISGLNQERPREGGGQLAATPGRPA